MEPEPGTQEPPTEQSHVVWRHGYDVLTRTTSAEVDHGSSYPGNHGSRCAEHYLGRVELNRRTGVQTATASCSFTLEWPGSPELEAVSVSSESRLILTADADAFDVRLELEVTDGGRPVVQQRWDRQIARRLG